MNDNRETACGLEVSDPPLSEARDIVGYVDVIRSGLTCHIEHRFEPWTDSIDEARPKRRQTAIEVSEALEEKCVPVAGTMPIRYCAVVYEEGYDIGC